MSARTVLVFCSVAIMARSAFCACAPGLATSSGLAGSGYSNYGAGLNSCGCSSAGVASTGGSLPVASASPVAPVGVSLLSENAYEGELCTSGNLPFLGTVGIEGVLPTAGAGSVSYGCGNGAVGIASEGPINSGIIGSALRKSALGACAGTGYGLAGSYGANLGSCGCGGIRSPSGFVGYGAGLGSYGCGGVASTGGGLSVVSVSPIAPAGISVLSDNAYEGSLFAGGNLPFLSAVGIEGALPTVGAGAVSYGCGNGAVGITSEGPIGTGILAAGSFPPSGIAGNAGYGIAGYGLGGIGYGLGSLGCGCTC